MGQIYNAELINNQIFWLDDKPKILFKDIRYNIKVIIERTEIVERTGKDMISFFKNSPVFDIGLDLQRELDFGREFEI